MYCCILIFTQHVNVLGNMFVTLCLWSDQHCYQERSACLIHSHWTHLFDSFCFSTSHNKDEEHTQPFRERCCEWLVLVVAFIHKCHVSNLSFLFMWRDHFAAVIWDHTVVLSLVSVHFLKPVSFFVGNCKHQPFPCVFFMSRISSVCHLFTVRTQAPLDDTG